MRRDVTLVLMIDDQYYLVTQLDSPVPCYQLQKADGLAYTVALTEWGPTCDCPNQVYKNEDLGPQVCKHIAALAHYGMLR